MNKQLGTKTLLIAVTVASILFACYQWNGVQGTVVVSGIFAYISFNYGLRLTEEEQFPFLFVGLMSLLVAAGVLALV